jgi:hypothetical protein
MKKRLVSLVAAAALLGSVTIASAGTVTTKGDTNVSIGGFIQTYFDWVNNGSSPLGYTANPAYTAPGKKNTQALTQFSTNSQWSRLSFGLSNPTEGITGLVEGDFWGSNFRLRHAYIVKDFCQEGCNYTPWLLIGRTWDPVAILDNFTLNSVYGIAGQNGDGNPRLEQIGFGVKFDLGSVKLNPAIYAANLSGDSTLTNANFANNVSVKSRLVSPGFAVKVPVEFNTGLGAPATFTAAFEWQPMKLDAIAVKGNALNALVDSENENGWAMSASLKLPVYFVNLLGTLYYERGMTAIDEPYNNTTNTMPSFYVDDNGSVQAVRGTSWSTQAQIDFNKLAQVPMTLAFGYGQTVYGNYGNVDDTTKSPIVRKMSTMFANVNYNLTKSLALGLEYDRNKTYYIGAGNDGSSGQNGNQVFLRGMYSF